MEKMNDLKDLLRHEIQDLYSAEEQIIAAMPSMIDKAKNADLKKALQNHLKTTEQQRSRLEQVQNMLTEGEEMTEEKKGLLSRLFKSRQVCRGMQGLIEEGTKVMNEEMDQDVRDAAIIASAQKIEHYEICGYGTARTYARELNLERAAQLLEQTLNEEYQADDMLTQLAVSHINLKAETGAPGKRGAERMQGRSASPRGTTQERARMEEPEMEMVSSRGRSAAGSSRTTAAGRGSSALPRSAETSRTRGTEPSKARTTAASTRSTGATSRSTSGGRTTTGRTTTTGGRTGASSGRTGTASRSETGSSRGTGRASGSGRSDATSRGSSRGR